MCKFITPCSRFRWVTFGSSTRLSDWSKHYCYNYYNISNYMAGTSDALAKTQSHFCFRHTWLMPSKSFFTFFPSKSSLLLKWPYAPRWASTLLELGGITFPWNPWRVVLIRNCHKRLHRHTEERKKGDISFFGLSTPRPLRATVKINEVKDIFLRLTILLIE